MRALWRRYGAGPGHLLLSAACLAIAAAAVIGWTQRPGDLMSVLIWFAAAVLLHDLVALPLYTLLDRHSIGRFHPHLAASPPSSQDSSCSPPSRPCSASAPTRPSS